MKKNEKVPPKLTAKNTNKKTTTKTTKKYHSSIQLAKITKQILLKRSHKTTTNWGANHLE